LNRGSQAFLWEDPKAASAWFEAWTRLADDPSFSAWTSMVVMGSGRTVGRPPRRDKGIPQHEIPPPSLRSIRNPDPRAGRHSWRGPTRLQEQPFRGHQIGSVEVPSYLQGLRQFPRAVGQVQDPLFSTVLLHRLDAFLRLNGPNKHCGRSPSRLAGQVEAEVVAVCEVDIGVPWLTEHHLVALRLPTIGVTGWVSGSPVGLGLNDDPGKPSSIHDSDEKLPQSSPGDLWRTRSVEDPIEPRQAGRNARRCLIYTTQRISFQGGDAAPSRDRGLQELNKSKREGSSTG